MEHACNRGFGRPDETRQFKDHGHVDLVTFDDGATVGRGVLEPGWRWSTDVRPIAGTNSCETMHTGYCLSGRMTVRMDSGEEFTITAGEAFHIGPGHDAWTVGDEPCVLIDVGMTHYAERA